MISSSRYFNLIAIALFCATSSLPSVAVSDPIGAEGAFYALSVANHEEMVAWYTENLGFVIRSQGGNDQRTGALLARSGALLEIAQFVGAKSRASLEPGLESHQIFGVFKIGFLVQDIDATYQKIVKKDEVDLFFPIVTASDGRRTFGVKDPEGNVVQFFGN